MRDAENARLEEIDRLAEEEDNRDEEAQRELSQKDPDDLNEDDESLLQILKYEQPERETRYIAPSAKLPFRFPGPRYSFFPLRYGLISCRKEERATRRKLRAETPPPPEPVHDPLGIQAHLYSNLATVQAYHNEHELNKRRYYNSTNLILLKSLERKARESPFYFQSSLFVCLFILGLGRMCYLKASLPLEKYPGLGKALLRRTFTNKRRTPYVDLTFPTRNGELFPSDFVSCRS